MEEADEIGGEQGGDSSSAKTSHAAKGEEWLDRHLARVGRSKRDLARELWTRGETAVAEVSRFDKAGRRDSDGLTLYPSSHSFVMIPLKNTFWRIPRKSLACISMV